MAKQQQASNQVDELLDELFAEYQNPEEVLGKLGLLKQLSQRLIERGLAGE